MSKYLLFLSALFLLTCESSERIWSNPNDPEMGIDPEDWAPSNLQAQVLNDSQIKLTWSQGETNISGFKIDRTSGGGFTRIAEVGADVREYTDTGLELDTDYTYRVKAFTDDNLSGYATSNTTNTSFTSPTNLIATPVDDQSIQLTWTDNCSFESGFRLERSTGGNFAQIAELEADVTEYTDGGLTIDVDYTYRVKAFTDANESEYTNTVEMTLFYDCASEFMGTAIEDCAGECNGTAFVNACEYCVGGNTGIDENYCSTLTDIDGNEYETIIIGDQAWMMENLKVTHYRDGTAIPTGYSNSVWGILSSGAYCAYDDNESNADTYGYLYNWYAVDDSRNIAPEGWHVPTDDEWKELEMYLGMSQSEADDQGGRGTDEGGKLKEEGTTHWNSPNTGATNVSVFTALPGGYRDYDDGYYDDMGGTGCFWSSTEKYGIGAWSRSLHYYSSDVARYYSYKRAGFSVRCLRD